jgi:hypothetical protein
MSDSAKDTEVAWCDGCQQLVRLEEFSAQHKKFKITQHTSHRCTQRGFQGIIVKTRKDKNDQWQRKLVHPSDLY